MIINAALFISDLHLSAEHPHTSAAFFDWLSGPARQVPHLFILGDLFDYWVGDDELDAPSKFHQQVIDALHACAQRGVAIYLMHGNRDFLLGERFAKAAGITLIADPLRIELTGIPTLLTHGDQLCTDDLSYQEFRTQVRNDTWQKNFLAQPLATRHAQVKQLRERSTQEKSGKSAAYMDVNLQAVRELMQQYQVTRLIHGHTHRSACHEEAWWVRWVLSDWEFEGNKTRGNVLLCDKDKWHFITVPPSKRP